MSRTMRDLVATVLAGAIACSVAATPPSNERIQLAEQRQAIERRFAAEQAECGNRFAVTSCTEAARLKRRDALAVLQQEEAAQAMNDRQATAERRRAAIQSRAVADAKRPAESASAAAAPASATRVERAVATPKRSPVESRTASPVDIESRQARARRARADYEKRQRNAEAHRLEVERRNAKRAARGLKSAAPLPTPASAASR